MSERTDGDQYLLKEIVPLEKGKPVVQLSGRHLLNDLQANLDNWLCCCGASPSYS